MSDGKITYELDLDTDTVKPAIKTAEDMFQKSGKRSGDKFSASFGSVTKSLTGSLFSVKAAILSIGSAVAAAFATGKLIQAANTQEDAINKLNSALIASNSFTEQASLSLQDYASSLQEITTFWDEAIIGQLAFAKAMGASNDQAKDIVTAAADMATALDQDLNSAVRNISKTLGGYAGELGEVIPELKNLTQEQLRAGDGIKLLADRYAGFATRATRTFSGATTQLSNVFGDLQEELGFAITKNSKVTTGVNVISKAFIELTKYVKQNRDQIKSLVSDGFILLIESFVGMVNGAIDLISVFKTVSSAFDQFADNVAKGSLYVRTMFEKLKRSLGLDNIAESLEAGADKIDAFFKERELQRDAELSSSLDRLDETKSKINSVVNEISQKIADTKIDVSDSINTDGVKDKTDKIKETVNKLTFDLNKSFGSLVAGGLSGFFDALIESRKPLEAFGDFVLGVFGTMATQLGQFFIATGIAKLKLFALDPTGTIAAGVGLVALGSLLKSFQSGGAASLASGSTGGQPTEQSNTFVNETTSLADLQEATPTLTVNIQGNYLDTEENGQYLVNAINSAISNSNVKITKRAFA